MALQGILVVVLTLAQEPPGRALVSPDPPREHSLQTHDLHYAARRGDLEAVRAAVIAGADVNEVRILRGVDGSASQTPLFIAAERGHARARGAAALG